MSAVQGRRRRRAASTLVERWTTVDGVRVLCRARDRRRRGRALPRTCRRSSSWERDPLLPDAERIREVASRTENSVLAVVMGGAAHAINSSHPGELAHLIRLFMADQPIVDDPDAPGEVHLIEIHRGTRHPRPSAA